MQFLSIKKPKHQIKTLNINNVYEISIKTSTCGVS